MMKITISVPGTFWAFRIASEVERRGATAHVYTNQPRFRLSTEFPADRTYPIRYPGLVKQLGYQLPSGGRLSRITRWNRPLERWGDYLFDRAVSRRLRPAENALLLGFAGACRDTVRRANELGFTTVVERSSSHIRTQRRLLREEYDRHDVDGQPISIAHVEREEAEYAAADYVVTPSRFSYESFLEQGMDERKLKRIPFGTNVDFEPPNRDERDAPITFLFAGHASLRKGLQYLLKAWDSISLPDAELVVAGHVDDAVVDLIDEYADDSVRFLGWIDDMEQVYRDASVFVLPTVEEGSARVTYEAMAWGLPVITTFNSGWVGTDGEHGIEVPIRDSEAVAAAMCRLYEDEETRHRMGENGRELIEQKYTWDDYGERVWRTHQNIIEM